MDLKQRNGLLLPRVLLIALGVSLVCLGLYRGEHLAVLERAVRICLECIGIG
jgi:hypothetical protein